MTDETLYIICWENLKTGKEGKGEHVLPARAADAALLELNALSPDFKYWKEEAQSNVTVTINA